jgi:uncharacterized protein YqfA (UPF0365 family)
VGGNNTLYWLVWFTVALSAAILPLASLAFVRPWVRAAASGAPVSLLSIVAMRMRGDPAMLLIDAYIALKRAGVHATIVDVESVYIEQRTRVRSRDDLVELVKNAVAEPRTRAVS